MSSVAVGVEVNPNGMEMHLIRDWELLFRLNALAEGRGVRRPRSSTAPEDTDDVRSALNLSQSFVEKNLQGLDLPYLVPSVTALAVLWPIEVISQSVSDDLITEEVESPGARKAD